MNKYLPYILIVAVLAALFFASQWFRSKKILNEKESIIAEKNAQIEYHINNKGRIVAEKVAAEASVKELKEAYPHLVKELKEDFQVEMKRMKAYIKNEFEARGSGMSSITNNYYDTATNTIGKNLHFSDGYLDFNSMFADSARFAYSTYTYTDTIKTVIHGKKKWVFGNEKIFASSTLSNPSAKVTGTTNLLVNHRDKRWVVSAGIYGDPLRKQYGVGLHLGYALFKF